MKDSQGPGRRPGPLACLVAPGRSFWGYVLRSTLVIEAPCWLIGFAMVYAEQAGWYHPTPYHSPFLDWSLVSLILVGPVAETFLLAGLAALLSRVVHQPLVLAGLSGLVWGVLHGQDFGGEFWGAFWSFTLMTLAYLAWRPRSYWLGYLAAMLPHLFHDTLCYVLLHQ